MSHQKNVALSPCHVCPLHDWRLVSRSDTYPPGPARLGATFLNFPSRRCNILIILILILIICQIYQPRIFRHPLLSSKRQVSDRAVKLCLVHLPNSQHQFSAWAAIRLNLSVQSCMPNHGTSWNWVGRLGAYPCIAGKKKHSCHNQGKF